MSESKTYVFDSASGNGGGGSNGILAMLPALMQQRGVDPNILALMGNKGGGFGNGGDDLFAILLLFILMGGWGNNGNGFGNRGGMTGNGQGGVVPFVQNDANTAVIMQSVQRNGFDIQSLATALNTSSDAVLAAVNGLGMQICNIGNQMGMNTNQIITAIMQGNNSIQQEICNCCCTTNNNITKMGYENQLAMCTQTNTLVNTANQNTQTLRDSQQSGTAAILAKIDQMNVQHLQDKLDAERDARFALKAQLDNEHQTQLLMQSQAQMLAPVNGTLADLSQRLGKIECQLPPTVAVPYPQLSVYNPEVYRAAAYGAFQGDVAARAVTSGGCGC